MLNQVLQALRTLIWLWIRILRPSRINPFQQVDIVGGGPIFQWSAWLFHKQFERQMRLRGHRRTP